MSNLPDVDIDVKQRDRIIPLFQFVSATELNPDSTKQVKHKTGVYPQKIPVDPYSGLAAFPYEYAEALGYFKVDLIPNHVYDQIESEDHLNELLREPVQWWWFLDERFYGQGILDEPLTHLGNHFDLVKKYPPESIRDVAVLLAVLRPGKREMIGQPWKFICERIWLRPNDSTAYTFKLPHAMAFASLVCLHARLIAKKL